MARIKILSDLHLEFYRYSNISNIIESLKTDADIFVIAGDLYNAFQSANYGEVLTQLQYAAKHVVLVLGNHEYYNPNSLSIQDINKYPWVVNSESFYPNIHILTPEKGIVNIEGLNFYGGTLWFPADPMNALYQSNMSDYHHINNWLSDAVKEYEKFKANYPSNADIVVSHHIPTHQAVSTEYKTHPLNRFFVGNCEDLILKYNPKAWIFGHSHVDYHGYINNTQLILNSAGYPGEKQINHNFIIEV